MNLFRSEDHVSRWLDDGQTGTTIPVTQLAELATAWWGDRLAPSWRPHTRDQNQAILQEVGLTTPFWELP